MSSIPVNVDLHLIARPEAKAQLIANLQRSRLEALGRLLKEVTTAQDHTSEKPIDRLWSEQCLLISIGNLTNQLIQYQAALNSEAWDTQYTQ